MRRVVPKRGGASEPVPGGHAAETITAVDKPHPIGLKGTYVPGLEAPLKRSRCRNHPTTLPPVRFSSGWYLHPHNPPYTHQQQHPGLVAAGACEAGLARGSSAAVLPPHGDAAKTRGKSNAASQRHGHAAQRHSLHLMPVLADW